MPDALKCPRCGTNLLQVDLFALIAHDRYEFGIYINRNVYRCPCGPLAVVEGDYVEWYVPMDYAKDVAQFQAKLQAKWKEKTTVTQGSPRSWRRVVAGKSATDKKRRSHASKLLADLERAIPEARRQAAIAEGYAGNDHKDATTSDAEKSSLTRDEK